MKIGIWNTIDCRFQYIHELLFFWWVFGIRRMDGSAEYCMEFSMFKQIAAYPYKGAIMRKRCSDFSLWCGVFWLRRLKYARYENLVLGCVIGKPLAREILLNYISFSSVFMMREVE